MIKQVREELFPSSKQGQPLISDIILQSLHNQNTMDSPNNTKLSLLLDQNSGVQLIWPHGPSEWYKTGPQTGSKTQSQTIPQNWNWATSAFITVASRAMAATVPPANKCLAQQTALQTRCCSSAAQIMRVRLSMDSKFSDKICLSNINCHGSWSCNNQLPQISGPLYQ